MRHRWLTERQFEAALLQMITSHNRLGFPEPIPFPDRERIARAAGIVVSANEPVFGRWRYHSLSGKASYVFYELIKQHVFFNGNKRIATYFLLHLLEQHDFILDMPPAALADLSVTVAESLAADREKVIKRTQRIITRNTMTIEAWKMWQDVFRRQRE